MSQSVRSEVPNWVPKGRKESPWFKKVKLAVSDDGLNFEKTHRILVDRGDSSNLCMDSDGRILASFMWFSFRQEKDFNKIAVSVSLDEGETWDGPKCINIGGIRSGDPSMVLLDDGRLRLYANSGMASGADSIRRLGLVSAVSGNGIDFTLETGYRFIHEITGAPLCPMVLKIGDEWHYYVASTVNFHAVSSDGLNFKRVENIPLPENTLMLGCAIAVDDGYRAYILTPNRKEKRLGITSAFSTDGYKWTMDPGVRVDHGADPGVIRLRNGKYLMSYSEHRFPNI